MPFCLQHRETNCLLLIEGYGEKKRDSWLELRDKQHATKFATVDEAKTAAKQFSLTNTNYKITNV